MSRIGKKPIPVPDNVTVTATGNGVVVKGPKGELNRTLPMGILVEAKGNTATVTIGNPLHTNFALWGLSRALVANMVEGVSKGFEKKLEYEGIGYRISIEDGSLLLRVGFSHPVRFPAPPGISFSIEKNVVTVSGINNETVGETAARIRAIKPPEPYKGKGIRYQGEVIRRKAGKKAVGSI